VAPDTKTFQVNERRNATGIVVLPDFMGVEVSALPRPSSAKDAGLASNVKNFTTDRVPLGSLEHLLSGETEQRLRR
jgi:hypothetical protein